MVILLFYMRHAQVAWILPVITCYLNDFVLKAKNHLWFPFLSFWRGTEIFPWFFNDPFHLTIYFQLSFLSGRLNSKLAWKILLFFVICWASWPSLSTPNHGSRYQALFSPNLQTVMPVGTLKLRVTWKRTGKSCLSYPVRPWESQLMTNPEKNAWVSVSMELWAAVPSPSWKL